MGAPCAAAAVPLRLPRLQLVSSRCVFRYASAEDVVYCVCVFCGRVCACVMGFHGVAPPTPCCSSCRSNMSESNEARHHAFLKTDADWDTFSWSDTDIIIAVDMLVRDFFSHKRDADVPRRRQAVYMIRVLLDRHHDLVYDYLDKLCDDLIVRAVRVPDCETRKPELLAVHLLSLLVPALVRTPPPQHSTALHSVRPCTFRHLVGTSAYKCSAVRGLACSPLLSLTCHAVCAAHLCG
jgi:hypothetical protein